MALFCLVIDWRCYLPIKKSGEKAGFKGIVVQLAISPNIIIAIAIVQLLKEHYY